MKCFALSLIDSRGNRHFDEITQFIGHDNSGSFGVMSGHTHMISVLAYGLARFSDLNGQWHYLALPGAVLRFFNNRLTITTLHFFLGDDPEQICQQLIDEMAKIDSDIYKARETLAKIEDSLLGRLAALSKQQSEMYHHGF